MNNLQHIVKNDARVAMHMAVELCEQGDFDSVTEAFRWLMKEHEDGESCRQYPEQGERDKADERESYGSNYSRLFGTSERAARMIANACTYHGSFDCSYGCLADEAHCGCGDYDALLEWLRG